MNAWNIRYNTAYDFASNLEHEAYIFKDATCLRR